MAKIGRPTKYSIKILKKTTQYIDSFLRKEEIIDGEKVVNPLLNQIPYLEELALELNVDEDTINRWRKAKYKSGKHKYEEFYGAIKKLKTIQKLRLLKATFNKSTATGSIFQLKVNHKMIETNRNELTAKDGEKLFDPLKGMTDDQLRELAQRATKR